MHEGEEGEPRDDPDAQPPASVGTTSMVRRVARWAFPVVAVVALAVALWVQRVEVVAAIRTVSPWSFLAATLLAMLAALFPVLAWRTLIRDVGHTIPVVPAARVYLLSQLGKYIPGSVWTVVAQVELSRELRVPTRRSAAVAALQLVLAVVSGLLVTAVTLPAAMPGVRSRYWWFLLAVPPLVVLLHPRVVAWWTGLLFRLARRPMDPVRPTVRALSAGLAWMVVAWVVYGLQCYVLVADAGATGPAALLQSTGAFTLAWVAGFVLIFAPAGAGAREAVLVVALTPMVGTGKALVVALLSRLALTLADLLLAGLAVLLARAHGSASTSAPSTVSWSPDK
jgi:uncharacterized membrane protein YbhN (UPF0104 family)